MLAVVVVFLFFWECSSSQHHQITLEGFLAFPSSCHGVRAHFHITTHTNTWQINAQRQARRMGGVGRLSCVAVFLLPLEGGFFLFSFSSLLFSFSFTKHYTKIRHDLFSSSLLIRIFGLLFSLSTAGAGNIYFATYVRRKLERRERGCVCVCVGVWVCVPGERERVQTEKQQGGREGFGRGKRDLERIFFPSLSLFWYKQTKINNKSYCMIMREMNGRDEYYYNYNKSTTSNAWTTQHNKH